MSTKRLEEANNEYPVDETIEGEWKNIQNIIIWAAEESLGKIETERGRDRLRMWDEEMNRLVVDKCVAFRRWMRSKKVENK